MSPLPNVIPIAPGASPDDWLHLDLVCGLGEDLLPVVSNPKATISPESSMKDLGKVPSRYNGQHQAVGFAGWTQHRANPEEIAKWAKERDYGICIQTRRIRAIDVDVSDSGLAGRVADRLRDRTGADDRWPVRARANAAKFLVAFELPGDFTKRKFRTEHGIIEFLASGQQFVAVGTHPSGVRYEWAGGLPDAFPVLSADEFEALWADLVAEFGIEDSSEQTASVKAQKVGNAVSADPVAQFLLSTNRVRKAERDGRLHVVCPWADDHSSDTESATTYWPAHTGGYALGHFACLHAHCEHRTDQEFLDAIEYRPEDEFQPIADDGGPSAGSLQEPDADIRDQPIRDQPIRQEAPAGGQRFAVQPAHAFASARPPEWLVKGVLPRAELGVLFGESGSGKSFLALDIALALDAGEPWRGRATRRGRVVYIAAEGAGGFRNRLKAAAADRGLSLDAIGMGVIADAPNMMEKTDALDVAKAIKAAGGADLVIVDTWAQVTPGSNENSGEDMGRALSHCKGIRRATGAMVLLVHHSGKDSSKGARGWSGLRAAADVELEVLRDQDARSVSVTKMKDGEDGAEYAFRLETVVLGLDEDGEEVTSCVVRHAEGRVERSKRTPKGTVERIVVNVLTEALGSAMGGLVDRTLLMEGVIAQMTGPGEGKKDRRSERASRAIESLVGSRTLRVEGVRLGFSEGV